MISVVKDAVQASHAAGKETEGDIVRRFLLLAALSMALALVLSTPAMAQDPGAVDCGDFTTQEEAQAFFDSNDPANDPYLLDEDPGADDGMACENLPSDGSTVLPDDDPDGNQYGVDEEQYDAEIPATSPSTAPPMAEPAPSVSVLPETGGVVSPALLSVFAGIMLVGGGLFSAAIARRG